MYYLTNIILIGVKKKTLSENTKLFFSNIADIIGDYYEIVNEEGREIVIFSQEKELSEEELNQLEKEIDSLQKQEEDFETISVSLKVYNKGQLKYILAKTIGGGEINEISTK